MSRPHERPLRKLPTLEARRAELETCAFCPKLCRSSCPVSNAEPRETLIPWGKMTGAYAMANGDFALTHDNAAPSWACTGCLACSEACDHRNPVAATFVESRAALYERGLAPAAAAEVVARDDAREVSTRASVRALVTDRRVPRNSGGNALLLVGCVYTREFPDTAKNAVAVADAVLEGRDLRLYEGCCGLPLLLAGDRQGFDAHLETLAKARGESDRFVVVDPGCASALLQHAPNLEVELLVDLAHRSMNVFGEGAASSVTSGVPSYHDPCSLGRGLGRYDQPRALLARVIGTPPREFVHAREAALCSGGGGLVPITMPEVAKQIAATRTSIDELPPGGDDAAIVTACASSLRAFRGAGKVAYDLCDVLAKSLDRGSSPSKAPSA